MDFIKLLPLLFVAVPGGDSRAIDHQLLPVIPGYVPVYIERGPDVEIIYETGRRAVHDSEKVNDQIQLNRELARHPDDQHSVAENNEIPAATLPPSQSLESQLYQSPPAVTEELNQNPSSNNSKGLSRYSQNEKKLGNGKNNSSKIKDSIQNPRQQNGREIPID